MSRRPARQQQQQSHLEQSFVGSARWTAPEATLLSARERRAHPLWQWLARLGDADRERVLRERLPSVGITVFREMLSKHHEGLAERRHWFFSDVVFSPDAHPHFAAVSPEQKASTWPLFSTLRAPRAEAGDLQVRTWDSADAEFIGSFYVFASMRNAELDAWTVKGLTLKRLMYLLVVCSRGRFLTTCPELPQRGGEGGLLGTLAMPWFESRSTTALATHLAHLVELKLWREYICSNQSGGPIVGLPRPRHVEPSGADAKTREKIRAQNEEFEREVRSLRKDRKSLKCGAPLARASEAELAAHWAKLGAPERLRIVFGMMKDPVCRLVHQRVGAGEGRDSQDLPVLFTVGPYLEPPLQPWVAKRLKLFQSYQFRRGPAIKHDPTLISLLAALVELLDDALRRLTQVPQAGLAAFVQSLFMVRLPDFQSPCIELALHAGPRLEESLSRAAARAMLTSNGGGNAADDEHVLAQGNKSTKARKKAKKKAKKRAAAARGSSERKSGESGVLESAAEEWVAPVVAPVARFEPPPVIPIVIEDTSVPPVRFALKRSVESVADEKAGHGGLRRASDGTAESLLIGESSDEADAPSVKANDTAARYNVRTGHSSNSNNSSNARPLSRSSHGTTAVAPEPVTNKSVSQSSGTINGIHRSISQPASGLGSPQTNRRARAGQPRSQSPSTKGAGAETAIRSRRKSEESLSFVVPDAATVHAKRGTSVPTSVESSSHVSPRDEPAAAAAAEPVLLIPASVMPPPPRDPVPIAAHIRSSGSDSTQRLVATAAPFKLRSRTTDFMWRREEGFSRNTDTSLRSHLSSVLDLQPSAKTLVLTKEIYMVVKRMEQQVAAQRPFREMAISKIRAIVSGLWPQAHVEVFGSYATGLCLPSSDIDIVVVGAPSGITGMAPGQQPLGILTKEFISNHTKWFQKVQAIPTARIPIIKLIYKSRNEALGTLGDIPLDVTFTSEANKIHSGVAARELVKQLVTDYRDLKPLAFILKQFLYQRGLSNLFSGGISSYCLVLMIATFLGAYGLDVRDKNVGALLLDFLELFGKKFDFSRTGISMSSSSFFELSSQYAGRVPLWIDDPLNPGQNIGLNSFAMYRVKASFEMAFHTLNPPYSYASVRSYLGRILSGNESKQASASPQPGAPDKGPVSATPPPVNSRSFDAAEMERNFASGGESDCDEITFLAETEGDAAQEGFVAQTRKNRSLTTSNPSLAVPPFKRQASQPSMDTRAGASEPAASRAMQSGAPDDGGAGAMKTVEQIRSELQVEKIKSEELQQRLREEEEKVRLFQRMYEESQQMLAMMRTQLSKQLKPSGESAGAGQ